MRLTLVLTGAPNELTVTEVHGRRGGFRTRAIDDAMWRDGRFDGHDGHVVAVFPRRQLMVKAFSVPAVPVRRLAGVIEIEAGRHLAFPVSECSLTYLARSTSAGWQVLLAAAKREDIGEYLSAVRKRGFRRVRIIPSTIAIALGIDMAAPPAGPGRSEEKLVAVAGSDGVEVVRVVEGGVITASHFIDGEPERLKSGMELLLASERENGDDPPSIAFLPSGASGEAARQSLEAFLGFDARRLSDVSADTSSHIPDAVIQGAFNAASSEDAALFDLARDEGLAAAMERRRGATFRRLATIGLIALLPMLGYVAYTPVLGAAKLRQVAQERASIKAPITGLRATWAREGQNAAELRNWAAIATGRVPWVEALAELSEATPDGITIADARFEKGKSFSLVGVARSQDALSAFLRGLGQTRWFAGASLGYARYEDRGENAEGGLGFSVTGTFGGGRPR